MSDPLQIHPFSMDFNRPNKLTLGPEDAAAIRSRRNADPASPDYDPTEMFFQRVRREHSMSNSKSINALDALPTRSAASWTADHTNTSRPIMQSPGPSPTVASFPSRSKSFFSRSTPSLSPSIFKKLPQEVFDCVLDQLQALHADSLSPSCATCYIRDLVSLSLTTRQWERGVRGRIYTRIQITGSDSPTQLKKYKMKYGTRLRLLRRTLREKRLIASLVKELNVPDPNIPPFLPSGRPNSDFSQYRDLLASVVMVCSNLEKLTGFYYFYNHEFDRLTHALSTRRKLKEHVWVMGENSEVTQRSHNMVPPGLMDEQQVYEFQQYHYSWTQLETLMMCSPDSAGVLEHGVFVGVLQLLPSLKNLYVSSFDADDFTDETMLALPRLTSLRLEECDGVTDQGIARWSSTPAAQSIETLVLIHQNLTALLVISKILACLPSLYKLTIVQHDVAPSLPHSLMVLQPVLASPSLRHLHWEIAASSMRKATSAVRSTLRRSSNAQVTSSTETPNAHLALSILHSGFPSLLTLRAPQDVSPPGALQTVCRPTKNGQILQPADRYSLPAKSRAPNAAMPTALPLGNALHAARIRAQSYIDSTMKSNKEFVRVLVTDHSDYDPPKDSRSSATSSSYSRASTKNTDPDILFSPEDERFGVDLATDLAPAPSKEVMKNMINILRAPAPPSPLFTQSLDNRLTSAPLKVSEFSLPAFVGRVATSTSSPAAPPPKFHLLPDVPGYDAEGGIVGLVDLLGVKEKDGKAVSGRSLLKDGCTGKWNQGCSGGRDWWGHTERDRRIGTALNVKDFF